MSKTVFLSTVTNELGAVRQRLASLANRTKRLHVRHQDDFVNRGVLTLQMLEEEVAKSDLVVQVIGGQSGAVPPGEQVEALLTRHPEFAERFPDVVAAARQQKVSYTQWEAWLALFLSTSERPLRLCCYELTATRDGRDATQSAHVERLTQLKFYPTSVDSEHDPVDEIVLTLIALEFLTQAECRPICHLNYGTLGELFIGRETFLDDLHRRFEAARAAGRWPNQAVCGVGGLGKTQVAVEYALKYRDEYTAVLMINADTPELLRSGLAGLAGVLNANLDPATTDDVKEQATLKWLREHDGWLLIVDNADTQAARDEVTKRLAQWADGHVLISARFNQWPQTVEALDLHVLSVADASRFLLKATDGRRRVAVDDQEQVRLLAADDLDGLCLALEQAAAYIAEREISFAEYRRRWAENAKEVRTWADKSVMQYHTESDVSLSVATTWLTTFAELPPDARMLLQMFAWFAPDPIPQGLVDHPEFQQQLQAIHQHDAPASGPTEAESHEGVSDVGPDHSLARRAGDALQQSPNNSTDADVERALAALRRYSLFSRRPGDPADSAGRVHRVVQLITRERLDSDLRITTLTAALNGINAYIPDEPPPNDVRSWQLWNPIGPHVATLTQFGDEAGIVEPTSRLMSCLGRLFFAKSNWSDAEPLLRRALAIDEQSYGAEHLDVAIDLNNLAALLQATNRLAEAEPLMRRALAIDEQSYGAEHPRVAIDLNNLAALLQATNRLAEAEPLMRRALAIDEQSYGAEHPRVAIDLNNLAQLLQATNRLAEAEPLMRRALAIDEQSYGAEHPRVAIDLNNLAQLLQAKWHGLPARDDGKQRQHGQDARATLLAEAEPLMRRALAIDEQSYGAEHPDVAIDLNNLAQLLQATNRLAEAEPLMRRALAIDEQSYGAEHPRVAIRLNNLAQLLQAKWHGLPARDDGKQRQHGQDARATLLAEAEPLMRRGIKIFEMSRKANGHAHPHMRVAIANYVVLLCEMSRSRGQIIDSFQEIGISPHRLEFALPAKPHQGRNEPCACGSQKKFKECCGR